MIKVFAFDLDGTLTQHKTPLDNKNRAILERLAERYTLIMVGAGSCVRIHNQLGGFPIDVIGNYGMQYAKYEGGELRLVRDDSVPFEDKESIEKRVTVLREKHGFCDFSVTNDFIKFICAADNMCIAFAAFGMVSQKITLCRLL